LVIVLEYTGSTGDYLSVVSQCTKLYQSLYGPFLITTRQVECLPAELDDAVPVARRVDNPVFDRRRSIERYDGTLNKFLGARVRGAAFAALILRHAAMVRGSGGY
jgi:hypothetical protein